MRMAIKRAKRPVLDSREIEVNHSSPGLIQTEDCLRFH